jgi:2-methylcitrate dehydratase PrpD
MSADKTRAAFGIAASGAGGLARQQGSMVKPFHAGNAARNGVEAALLADKGFTADDAIIESSRGFCDSFFGEGTCDYDKMLQGLGDPFYLESPGLSFKLHPCGAPQFLAADAMLHLVREHKIQAGEVCNVELRVSPLRYKRHYRPSVQSGLQGKFTINYVCAVALLDGRLEKASFHDAKAKDPKVHETFNKIKVVVDESIPEKGEYCPITIELNDGRRFQYTATIQKGHAKNPLTEDEVLGKFRDNVKETIPPEKAQEIIACVDKLEEIANVRELTKLLLV